MNRLYQITDFCSSLGPVLKKRMGRGGFEPPSLPFPNLLFVNLSHWEKVSRRQNTRPNYTTAPNFFFLQKRKKFTKRKIL